MSQNNVNYNMGVFILGALFNILVSINLESLIDYSLKAIIGGGIWLAFQLIADYLKKKSDIKNNEGDGRRE